MLRARGWMLDHALIKKGLVAGLVVNSLLLGLLILGQCCKAPDAEGLSNALFLSLLIPGLLMWAGLFYLYLNGYRWIGVSPDHWRYGRTMSSRDARSIRQTPGAASGEWNLLLKEMIPVIAVVLGIFVLGVILRGYRASHPLPFDLIHQGAAADQIETLLAAYPALLKECSDAGETLLTAGVLAGRTDIVEVLLELGIDVEQLNIEGKSALMLAVAQPEVVNLLLENGADRDAVDPFGWTAVHHAVWQQCAESVRLLLQAEAAVNVRDREGRTPLTLALESGFEDIQPLLSHGAAVSSFNSNGETPLHVAARCNRPDAIRVLLRYGADPAVFSRLSWTPLHVAALHNAVEAAEVLLEAGAEVDQFNERDQSPMHCAVRNSREDMIELLMQHGSAVDPDEAAMTIASRPMNYTDYQNRIRLKPDEAHELGLTIQHQEKPMPELGETGRRKELNDLLNLRAE